MRKYVAAHADGSVTTRLQRADGWTTGGTIRGRAHMLGLGDVDLDGHLDLVTTDHDSADVTLLLGDGTGQFRARPPVRALEVTKPHNHGLIVADVDGDRDADVIVADQVAKRLVVLLANRGELRVHASITLPEQPYPPAAADLDRDGDLDIVVPLVGGRAVAVLLGDGAGAFATPVLARPYGVAVGDVDGDGRPDVVTSHDDTDHVAIFAGDGRGRLTERRTVELPGRIGRPLLADLEGDGMLDLVGAGTGRLVIAERGLTRIRTKPSTGWRVIAADLDGDRKPDLAANDEAAGVIRVWLSSTR